VLRQTQGDLTRMSRVITVGELAASLAHEINQPIAGAIVNANTCVRWLTRDQPDVEEAREAASRMAKDAVRAAEVINSIRLLFTKGTPKRELLDVNEVIRQIIGLLRHEAMQHSVSVRTELAEDLPRVMADRVQLQQVIMNLVMNSIDAMKQVDRARELKILSQRGEDGKLLLSISDSGVGLPKEGVDQLFNSFFTTKLKAWAWGFGSAALSLNRMEAACGPATTLRMAQVFISPYPPGRRIMNEHNWREWREFFQLRVVRHW
jgi:C4-dicarboxylate-specific signal transduction histidine kinase